MKGDAIHNDAGIEDATPGCLWWSSTCTHSASKASLQGAFCSMWGRTESSGPLPGGQQQLFCKVGSHMLVLCSHLLSSDGTIMLPFAGGTLCSARTRVPRSWGAYPWLWAGSPAAPGLLVWKSDVFQEPEKWNEKLRDQPRQDAKEVNRVGCGIFFQINGWCSHQKGL